VRATALGTAGPYQPEGYHRQGEAIGRPVIITDTQQPRGLAAYARNCYQCHQGGERGPDPRRADLAMKRQTRAMQRYATAIKALATVRRLLPPAPAPPGAGPAARPAGAGTREDEAGPESRRPKPGTSRAATVRDDRDPGEGTPVALFRAGRVARGRDG
jgi:hypothetical protein